jgi:hypothetical protein
MPSSLLHYSSFHFIPFGSFTRVPAEPGESLDDPPFSAPSPSLAAAEDDVLGNPSIEGANFPPFSLLNLPPLANGVPLLLLLLLPFPPANE